MILPQEEDEYDVQIIKYDFPLMTPLVAKGDGGLSWRSTGEF